MRDQVLALDIGTSSVRAILFDSRGNAVSANGGAVEAQVKYVQHTTADGGVEVDADHLVSVTVLCLSKAIRKIGKGRVRLAGVGISCFWHSLLGVGGDGRALTPLFSWADTRASSHVPQLRELFDATQYHQSTGAELHPCFWPAKLLWLRDERPEVFGDVKQWMGFAEYLMLRVFGSNDSSLSMASGTGLLNQRNADWDASVLTALDIDPATLPGISDQGCVRRMSDEFRDKLGGLDNLPWFPAVGDGACSNIGSGGCDDKRMVLNIGTSAAIRVVVPAPKGEPLAISQGLFCYRIDAQHAIHGGAFAQGGNVYAWLKGLLEWPDDNAFGARLARIKPDGHGLTVLPFWAGERSPGWRSGARAAILGMNLHTSREDIVRASLEACAYSFDVIKSRLCEQYPQAREIVLSGGATASSPLLCQIVCDVFGEPLVTSKVAEASSRGAALIALQGAGVVRSWSAVPFERGRVFRPNSARHELYTVGGNRYRRAYEAVAELE
ncbi:MAG TPA: gluconokinase [Capsulimonadaceae bacterium]|jgi:gluconokinase